MSHANASLRSKPIFFVASARDYHAVDWYRAIKRLCPGRRVGIVTDLVEGEGFDRIVDDRDEVVVLFPADRFLLKRQSRLGNLWRQFVKLATVPLIAWRLNRFSRRLAHPVLHAHSMYYIFLCWLARVKFIGTPMGSDVLVRPDESRLYRLGTIVSLRGAAELTVDSVALQDKIERLAGVPSAVVQNGIDAAATRAGRERTAPRTRVASVRGMDPNYRILELVEARNRERPDVRLDVLYPFHEEGYRERVRAALRDGDADRGRLTKPDLLALLAETLLMISIPVSDSSPRSVYEAIFSGCCVAVTPGKWIEAMPAAMRARLFIVDLASATWFADALAFAERLQTVPFVPDAESMDAYDEETVMKGVCRHYYGEEVA